ncbi:phosphoribosylanthranilate isomerase [Ferrovibrio terrae]|uniref:N-(5'-phosphoribosyl)anthranilate isomerase n=1 Tax=Ferrovibrio terrae TaxID=2594003 RepID=A0A516H243_9PROT|nr:phosphoribosylanthranilate isomerase [Ferrovibrio terrae]QDO97844.1 phosphoribosylanthranilate isomerase [Ferrovibrio terrae]
MPLFTKICGLTDAAAVEAAVTHGADMVGFVFYPSSPRNLGAEQAETLLHNVPSGIDRVGLFVDPETDFLDQILAKARLDLLQLHGDETPERCRAISVYFGLPIIKAIKVSTKADLKMAKDYEDAVDWLMFDARPAADGVALPGGNGKAFDWTILKGAEFKRPWLLAGGLTPDNLSQAVQQSGASAVDVSSGVESAPGQKDPAKIRAFLDAARRL